MGAVYLNAHERAINAARKLAAADVQRQIGIVDSAIATLLAGGRAAGAAWRDLADTYNVAEALAELRIGTGPDARQVLQQAQEALAYVAQEQAERATWALRAEDRCEVRLRLELLRDLHRVQLEVCSYGEFERAFRRVHERMAQARAGNVPAGAVVVEGLIR